MNSYLILLATQIGDIRDIMGWTQEDLCNSIGISRPVLSNIEKDPSKLSLTVALALFTATFGELAKRRLEILEAIEKVDFRDKDTVMKSFESAKWGKKTWANIVVKELGPAIISKLASTNNLGAVLFALGAGAVLSSEKINLKNSKNELKKAVVKSLDNKDQEILKCFGLDSCDLAMFLKLIEMGQIKK